MSAAPSIPISSAGADGADEQDRARSRFVPELADAIATQWHVPARGEALAPRLDFHEQRRRLASAFLEAGFTLPQGWDSPTASPPSGDAAAAHLQRDARPDEAWRSKRRRLGQRRADAAVAGGTETSSRATP